MIPTTGQGTTTFQQASNPLPSHFGGKCRFANPREIPHGLAAAQDDVKGLRVHKRGRSRLHSVRKKGGQESSALHGLRWHFYWPTTNKWPSFWL